MRKFHVKTSAAVIAIAVSISGTSFAGPLAPGKPAGVRQAQMGDKEWLVFGGLATLGAGILIVTAGGGNKNVPGQAISVITTSATAP